MGLKRLWNTLTGSTGHQLTPQASNPGDTNTLWADSNSNNELQLGAGPASGITRVTSGALTLNVATTGNNSTGDGSPGSPFATVPGALAYLDTRYAMGGEALVTIQLADGTYTVTTPEIWMSSQGLRVSIVGNTGTPANVNLITANNMAGSDMITVKGRLASIAGIKFESVSHLTLSNVQLLIMGPNAEVDLISDCEFDLGAGNGSGYCINGPDHCSVAITTTSFVVNSGNGALLLERNSSLETITGVTITLPANDFGIRMQYGCDARLSGLTITTTSTSATGVFLGYGCTAYLIGVNITGNDNSTTGLETFGLCHIYVWFCVFQELGEGVHAEHGSQVHLTGHVTLSNQWGTGNLSNTNIALSTSAGATPDFSEYGAVIYQYAP